MGRWRRGLLLITTNWAKSGTWEDLICNEHGLTDNERRRHLDFAIGETGGRQYIADAVTEHFLSI